MRSSNDNGKARRVHQCARCSEPVRQREPQVRVYGKRWHRRCWPGELPGRPPRADGAAVSVVGVRLTAEERERWDAAASAAREPLSAYVRAAVEARIARG